ncbi:hypothetical protein HMI56_000630 [Coelomomyces lativittatus]|nr:hypothetical protein HMI56_000630 [Coelomomyces lativittatus]
MYTSLKTSHAKKKVYPTPYLEVPPLDFGLFHTFMFQKEQWTYTGATDPSAYRSYTYPSRLIKVIEEVEPFIPEDLRVLKNKTMDLNDSVGEF